MHKTGLFGYNLFLLRLKIENWKYYSKIIIKCVNSAVRSVNCVKSVKVFFVLCAVNSCYITVYVQVKKKGMKM